MAHFRFELHTGCEAETIDLWLDAEKGRIEASHHGMGVAWRLYRLTCRHRPLSDAFGLLEVERAEVRTADGEFETCELEPEETLLPLVIEYVRVVPSPVFVHEGSSLSASGTWTTEFSLMLAVYDYDGRPEKGVARDIFDLLDKKKLAAITGEPRGMARGPA